MKETVQSSSRLYRFFLPVRKTTIPLHQTVSCSGEYSTLMDRFLSNSMVLSMDRTLNTDGKTTFNVLKDRINLHNYKVNYDDKNQRLHSLNIVIGDVKNQINVIYHGVSKRDLPLFLKEQEFRMNHRYTGKNYSIRYRTIFITHLQYRRSP